MNQAVRYSSLASALLLCVSSHAHAQQVPQAPNMSFFITSTSLGKGGDLGGLAGADAHCQQLAATAGAGNKTWHAYLSSPETPTAKAINARDRIGNGPWQNAKGVVIAQNVADLHSANNKLSRDTALTERGTIVGGVGYTPVWHDALTGSDREGRAFPGNINMTCNNWTSSELAKRCSAIPTAPASPTMTTRTRGIPRISRAVAARPTLPPQAATGCSTVSRSNG